MKISFETKGFKELNQNMIKLTTFRNADVIPVFKDFAIDVMEDSKKQVPIDTHALYNSAFIDTDDEGVTFGYGGDHAQYNPKTFKSTSDYEWAVHERLDVHHNVGKAKFFEEPLNKHVEQDNQKLLRAIWEKMLELIR